jgi:hypothetical protein
MEKEKLISFQVRVTEGEGAEVRRLAKEEDRSVASWLVRLVRRELGKEGG